MELEDAVAHLSEFRWLDGGDFNLVGFVDFGVELDLGDEGFELCEGFESLFVAGFVHVEVLLDEAQLYLKLDELFLDLWTFFFLWLVSFL